VVSNRAFAGLALLATSVVTAVLIARKEEVAPSPDGRLLIEIQPMGGLFEDVLGQPILYDEGAIVTVTGTATEGEPLPNMTLELYDGNALIDSAAQIGATLDVPYEVVTTITKRGTHHVSGKMTLSNELGDVEYETPDISFRIGKRPKGDLEIASEQVPQ